MDQTNNRKIQSTSKNVVFIVLDIALLVITFALAIWYALYQGGGDGFPRNETPGMYHLVGIAITLLIFTLLSMGFSILCIITQNKYLKLIPSIIFLFSLLPLLFFIYEIYRWS